MCQKSRSIYIVMSCNDTLAGKLIRNRGKLKFWNRYEGDCYGHVSLSLDPSLENMMSFARKDINNPLDSGLVEEDIHKGIFARSGIKSKIAVIKIAVSDIQFTKIKNLMKENWKKKNILRYNFLALFSMLLIGRGIEVENRYICSHWVAELLEKSDIFSGEKRPKDMRPLDYYDIFKEDIIYEGLTVDYRDDL